MASNVCQALGGGRAWGNCRAEGADAEHEPADECACGARESRCVDVVEPRRQPAEERAEGAGWGSADCSTLGRPRTYDTRRSVTILSLLSPLSSPPHLVSAPVSSYNMMDRFQTLLPISLRATTIREPRRIEDAADQPKSAGGRAGGAGEPCHAGESRAHSKPIDQRAGGAR